MIPSLEQDINAAVSEIRGMFREPVNPRVPLLIRGCLEMIYFRGYRSGLQDGRAGQVPALNVTPMPFKSERGKGPGVA